MSEPVVVGLIRDGQRRFYADRWAAAFLHREVVWGPEDFQAWAAKLMELDDWEDCAAGVIVDYDERRLTWTGADNYLQTPRVAVMYEQLLRAAWRNFEIITVLSIGDLARAAGEMEEGLIEASYDEDLHWRPQTIREAVGDIRDELDEHELDEFEDEPYAAGYDEDEVRAWVAVIDEQGVVRHRQLNELPRNLLLHRGDVVKQLLELPAADVPPEKLVSEAMWIDVPRRLVGVWGMPALHRDFGPMQNAWKEWDVNWAENGYVDQCQACGPIGVPMSDVEALAQVLHTLFSTKQMDLRALGGAIGAEVKKLGRIATGCLFAIICAPMLIFGLITQRWQAVGVSVLVTAIILAILFKIVEWRVKKSWAPTFTDDDEPKTEVCGPQDEHLRRGRLDQLLQEVGFPTFAAVEPHFPKDTDLDVL